MGAVLVGALKIGFVTIIVGQGLKLIDKKEFKALVDFCGFTAVGIIIAEQVIKSINEVEQSPLGKLVIKLGKLIKDNS